MYSSVSPNSGQYLRGKSFFDSFSRDELFFFFLPHLFYHSIVFTIPLLLITCNSIEPFFLPEVSSILHYTHLLVLLDYNLRITFIVAERAALL